MRRVVQRAGARFEKFFPAVAIEWAITATVPQAS